MLPREKDDFPPWGRRSRVMPLRTYSGKVSYMRKKHYFKIEDAQRIMNKVAPPTPEEEAKDTSNEPWQNKVMRILREMTLAMMEKILPMLNEQSISALYNWIYQLGAYIFRLGGNERYVKQETWNFIQALAAQAGLQVEVVRK